MVSNQCWAAAITLIEKKKKLNIQWIYFLSPWKLRESLVWREMREVNDFVIYCEIFCMHQYSNDRRALLQYLQICLQAKVFNIPRASTAVISLICVFNYAICIKILFIVYIYTMHCLTDFFYALLFVNEKKKTKQTLYVTLKHFF